MIDPQQFASWVSDEARADFAASASALSVPAGLDDRRKHYDVTNQAMLDAALARYPVAIAERTIGEVAVHSVTPPGGAQDPRTLLCLHGGAFMWGSGAGALLEAVPIAAITGMEVLAVEYRLAPEHTFPAAVDDVLAVYRDLLTRLESGSIGLYGCSAGGVLTSQAVARMVQDGLPIPGGIAMLHGTGLEFAGDSAAAAPTADLLPYFATADLRDPLVMPGNHPALLARFPPSLLISGTRDFAASACSVMHRRLLAAGVEAQFVLFDGLWHAHHMAVDLPESRETYALLDRFFKAQLK